MKSTSDSYPPGACLLFTLLAIFSISLTGCTHPSEDNIRLRKVNQDLETKIADLTTQNDSKQRTIDGLMRRDPKIPMLAADELKKLWVTAGLNFGRFTGGANLDDKKPGDQGLRVYICPADEAGMPIQAAGSFVVEAFDLAEKGDNRLGRWEFTAIDAKTLWRTFLFEFGYELTCPWQKLPTRSDITIRVTFTDGLTHIPFVAEKLVQVNIPPAPTTAPSP